MKKITNVYIVDAEKKYVGDVLFNDKILDVAPHINVKADEEIDGKNLMLCPGFIDPHVHFRTPGLEHKEDFFTGGLSALAGGVTTVFDMPNTIPPVFSTQEIETKKQIINKISPIYFELFICANEHNIEELKNANNAIGIKIFLNDTTGHLLLNNKKVLADILNLKKHISIHAEGDTFLETIELWEKLNYPCGIHLVHTTLKKEIDEIRRLKQHPIAKTKISCEVCPHHLLFTKEDAIKNPLLRMKPELANQEDVNALWQAIEDKIIDCFATDHAPHLLKEKQNHPPAFGVPGVETLFSLLFTEFKRRNFDITQLITMLTTNTLNIYKTGYQKGLIKKGYDANFCLIDIHHTHIIKSSHQHSKCGWTPYENMTVNAKVLKTFIAGHLQYDAENTFLKPKIIAQNHI